MPLPKLTPDNRIRSRPTQLTMLLADCGTIWSKILDTETNALEVIETSELLRRDDRVFDLATGHLGASRARRCENELVALALGALARVEDDSFVVVDVGGRDTKLCRFEGRRIRDINWNQACGATTGFTLDLLARHYDIDYHRLDPADDAIPVTCGVFGIERIFDAVVQGEAPERGVARFVRGVASNVAAFAGRPERLYLSGGLCANRCFVRSLEAYADVIPLGRDVPLQGLREVLRNEASGE